MKLEFMSALTPALSPKRGSFYWAAVALCGAVNAKDCQDLPRTDETSPSPEGEGRGEGERCTLTKFPCAKRHRRLLDNESTRQSLGQRKRR
jgi:hypothetical protein